MDFINLKNRPTGPFSGGFSKVMIALATDILTIPDRDVTNKGVMSNDIVFKTGKGWNILYTTKDTLKVTEKGSGKRDNDSQTSTFVAKYPGLGDAINQLTSEYASQEFYLLVYKCDSTYPILVGRKCNPAFLDFEYDSGSTATDDDANTLTFVSTGPYRSAIYKGAITNGQTIFAADDTTPDVSSGTQFMTSANTAANEITDLDNAVVGSTITILGGSNTNSSTITNGGNFTLTASMTLSLGTYITLYVRGVDDFVELARG